MFKAPNKARTSKIVSINEVQKPDVQNSEIIEEPDENFSPRRSGSIIKLDGFVFWYNEARKYLKTGFFNKALTVINNYQEQIMKVLPLDQRIKCCRLLLFCLNKLIERKYLSKNKLINSDKVLEALRLGVLYTRIFHECLNGFLDDRNPYANIRKLRNSISLHSPLKKNRSVSSGNAAAAQNMNTLEVNMSKRFSKGIFSSNFEEDDYDTLSGFYYDNTMKRNPPSKCKMKLYVNSYMIYYLKILLNFAIYYKKKNEVPLASKFFHYSMVVIEEFETNSSLDPEIMKAISHTRICLGNFFNEVQCFHDAISNFEHAFTILHTELNYHYNSATKRSVMKLMLDYSNKKILRCVNSMFFKQLTHKLLNIKIKKIIVVLYNISFSWEYLEDYSKCLESLKLGSWLSSRYLDPNNNLGRAINNQLKISRTQYTTYLKDIHDINKVCQMGLGTNDEYKEAGRSFGPQNGFKVDSSNFYGEFLYHKLGGDHINNRFVIVHDSLKPIDQGLDPNDNDPNKSEGMGRGHRRIKTLTEIVRKADSFIKHVRKGSDLTNATNDTNIGSVDFNKAFEGFSIETDFKPFNYIDDGSVNSSVGRTRTTTNTNPQALNILSKSEKNSVLSATDNILMRIKNDFGEVMNNQKGKKEVKVGKSVTSYGNKSPVQKLRLGKLGSTVSRVDTLMSNRDKLNNEITPQVRTPKLLTTNKYFMKMPTMGEKVKQLNLKKDEFKVKKPEIVGEKEETDEAAEEKIIEMNLLNNLTSETLDNYFQNFIHRRMDDEKNIKSLLDVDQETHEQMKEEDFDKKEFSTASKILKLRRKFGTGKSLPGLFKGIGNYNIVDESKRVENHANISFVVFNAEKNYKEKLEILRNIKNEKENTEFENKLISKEEVEEKGISLLRNLIRKNKKVILSGYFQTKLRNSENTITQTSSRVKTIFEQTPIMGKLENADQAKIMTSMKKQRDRMKILLEKCEKNIEEANIDQTRLIEKHFHRKLRMDHLPTLESSDLEHQASNHGNLRTFRDLSESTYLMALKQSKLADLKTIFNAGLNKDKRSKFSSIISQHDSKKDAPSHKKKILLGALKRIDTGFNPTKPLSGSEFPDLEDEQN